MVTGIAFSKRFSENHHMRRLLPSLLLGCLALTASAADLLGPADYLKILVDSKLHYNVQSEPAKKPLEEMVCARRDASMRVVQNGKEKTLVAWTVKPEASSLFDEGESFYQAEKYAEAAAKYRQAIEADPEAVAAYFCYGDTFLFGAKDPAGALAQYQKGIALDPTLPLGYFFSSTALVQLGKRSIPATSPSGRSRRRIPGSGRSSLSSAILSIRRRDTSARRERTASTSSAERTVSGSATRPAKPHGRTSLVSQNREVTRVGRSTRSERAS
jgi:tetratricopeptide (TPR) repeat protein